ncbi:MAG: Phytochrome, two-component sensor histidine kinase, partial [Labilithrix sp.]|nr:Phytochrome, two-component sensor histidine kinase [Labilithrix sp.]
MDTRAPDSPGRAASPTLQLSADERRILDAIGEAVIVTDPSGNVASWNRAAEALYGWSASDAIGKNIIELTPSDLSRDKAQEILERLSHGASWQGELVVRRSDGTPFVARVTDAPLLGDDGQLTGIIGVSQDASVADGALRHLGFLAEASRALGASLDYERTLRDVARVLVPGFADACSVFVMDAGVLVRVAEAGVDDDTEATLRALRSTEVPSALSTLFAEVMDTGRARLVPDYMAHLAESDGEAEDAYRARVETLQVGSVIVAPMIARGKPVGALTLGLLRRAGRLFSVPDTSFAEELGRRVALAIDNARLYSKAEAARAALEQREQALIEERRIFETLYRIGASLAKEHEEQKLIQLVTDEATSLTGANFGSFFFDVTSAEGESYTLYSLSGAPREAFASFRLPRATPPFGPTFRGQGVIRCDDVRKDPRYGLWGPQPPGHLPVVSYLAVPVVTRTGEVLGGLFFAHREAGRFTSEHERLVVGIAGQAAIALENARLYAQLRKSEANARDAFAIARQAERRKDEFLAMLGHEL